MPSLTDVVRTLIRCRHFPHQKEQVFGLDIPSHGGGFRTGGIQGHLYASVDFLTIFQRFRYLEIADNPNKCNAFTVTLTQPTRCSLCLVH